MAVSRIIKSDTHGKSVKYPKQSALKQMLHRKYTSNGMYIYTKLHIL